MRFGLRNVLSLQERKRKVEVYYWWNIYDRRGRVVGKHWRHLIEQEQQARSCAFGVPYQTYDWTNWYAIEDVTWDRFF
jgi:hypothetical protein